MTSTSAITKCWKTAFYQLIDVAVVNTYILYNISIAGLQNKFSKLFQCTEQQRVHEYLPVWTGVHPYFESVQP